MSQIVNPLQALIDQAALTKPKSKIVEQYAQRLDPKKTKTKSLLLLDLSSSMLEWIGMGIQKIDLLRSALDRPLQSGEVAIGFNSICFSIQDLQNIPEPNGGTALHIAIADAVPLRPRQTLVVSDGKPDDENQALAAAKKLTGIINTLYIGKDSDVAAIDFMGRLSRLGCGSAQTHDVYKQPDPKLLGQAIALLLPAKH